MLVAEAVHLVLHAARLAKGGELFVLEMGAQISVVDMARNLIRLSGLVPDKDMALTYVGCRPGEKLVEELVADHERAESTPVSNVLCVRPDPARDLSRLAALVGRLEESAAEGSVSQVLNLLGVILPTYRPATTPGLLDGPHDVEGGAADDAPASSADHVTASGLSPTGPPRRT
jgi:FlaA1/EpsC-like NDP-sugar epimerase